MTDRDRQLLAAVAVEVAGHGGVDVAAGLLGLRVRRVPLPATVGVRERGLQAARADLVEPRLAVDVGDDVGG